MTTTELLAGARSAGRVGATVRTVRTLTRFLLLQASWYLAIVLVLAVAAIAVMIALVDEPSVSVVQFGRQSAVWYPFAIAATLHAAFLPAHVAVGMTRASFVRGALLAALVMAVLYSAVFTGAMALEAAVYDAAGWQHRITDGAWFTRDPGDLGAVAIAQLVSVMAAHCGGYLVAATYHRVGGWWGTALLPLTAGPVLGVVGLLSQWVDADLIAPGLRLALAVLATAALAAAFAALARRFAMKPTGG